jgi:hypothetical protein
MREKRRRGRRARRVADERFAQDVRRLLQRGKAKALRLGYWSGTVRRVA